MITDIDLFKEQSCQEMGTFILKENTVLFQDVQQWKDTILTSHNDHIQAMQKDLQKNIREITDEIRRDFTSLTTNLRDNITTSFGSIIHSELEKLFIDDTSAIYDTVIKLNKSDLHWSQ